jgi:hypothetical protein
MARCDRRVKARPAGAGVELGVRPEQIEIAAHAAINARLWAV